MSFQVFVDSTSFGIADAFVDFTWFGNMNESDTGFPVAAGLGDKIRLGGTVEVVFLIGVTWLGIGFGKYTSSSLSELKSRRLILMGRRALIMIT